MAQAPLSPRVLKELRSRGVITVQWFMEDCRRFPAWQHLAAYYDYFFVIQREFCAAVEQAGAGRSLYLPMACDPAVHRPVSVDPTEPWGSDISFVGAGYNNRQQMFAGLAAQDFKIWGSDWPGGKPFDRLVQEGGRRISPEEYVKIFSASKINLNLHSSSERDGVEPEGDFVNPRTFELAACGAFQLVDERKHLPELFCPKSELVTFRDRREMEDLIQYYLAHPAERQAVAHRARERVLRDHTYEARIRTMLSAIYADRFEQLKSRQGESPWSRTLARAAQHPELQQLLDQVYQRGEEPALDFLIGRIQESKGTLSETEQKLLFLHHVKSQIEHVQNRRNGS
jgi:spore maturation protein CgeB